MSVFCQITSKFTMTLLRNTQSAQMSQLVATIEVAQNATPLVENVKNANPPTVKLQELLPIRTSDAIDLPPILDLMD